MVFPLETLFCFSLCKAQTVSQGPWVAFTEHFPVVGPVQATHTPFDSTLIPCAHFTDKIQLNRFSSASIPMSLSLCISFCFQSQCQGFTASSHAFCSVVFPDRVSLCNPSCPETYSVDQAGVEHSRDPPASTS